MDDSTTALKTTRSILVIEEEYDLRVLLMQALNADNWNVLFALTEETIAEAVSEVAGVIMNWELPDLLDRDKILKLFGELPVVVATKPYAVSEIVQQAQEKITKDRFFVGDRVISKITPDWGEGVIVSLYSDNFYGVIFKTDSHRNSSEIAMRCHYTGLKWVKD